MRSTETPFFPVSGGHTLSLAASLQLSVGTLWAIMNTCTTVPELNTCTIVPAFVSTSAAAARTSTPVIRLMSCRRLSEEFLEKLPMKLLHLSRAGGRLRQGSLRA